MACQKHGIHLAIYVKESGFKLIFCREKRLDAHPPSGSFTSLLTEAQKAGSAKATSMPFWGNVPLKILRLQAASHGCSAGVSLFVRAVSETAENLS